MTDLIVSPQSSAIVVADPAPRWRDVMETWLNTKQSRRTRAEYQKIVTHAMQTLGDFDGLTPQTLTAWGRALVERMERSREDRLSANTVKLRIGVVREFLKFAYLAGESRIPDNALVVLLKPPKGDVERPHVVLSEDEMDSLIDGAQTLRDRALIAVTEDLALRCAEVLALRCADFYQNETGAWMVTIYGKGNKVRRLPVPARSQLILSDYLTETQRALGDGDSAVFGALRGGKAITPARYRQIMRRARRGLGKSPSIHALRHTGAMRIMRRKRDVNVVSKVLGHASLTPTKRYLDHLEIDELAEAMER